MDESTGPIEPVFVVGMNGSGTTMLADSLGMHPALYMFSHEVRLLPYLVKNRARYGDLDQLGNRRRLAAELCAAKPFWHVNKRTPVQMPDECLQAPGFAATIDGVFAHFAAREGKRRWGEKSPMNVLHMPALAAVFPGARFIHIIRDGRDAAQSFHRRFGFVPAETIWRWKRVVAQGREQGRALGPQRYFELRYEQLTAEPEAWMRQLCDFLQLPFDAAVLTASMRMADPALAAERGQIARNSGKWSAYFSAREVRQLERIAGRELAVLGYDVGETGDEHPGRLRLAWWRVVGIVRRTRLHFKERGLPGLRGYLKSAWVSIKQMHAGR